VQKCSVHGRLDGGQQIRREQLSKAAREIITLGRAGPWGDQHAAGKLRRQSGKRLSAASSACTMRSAIWRAPSAIPASLTLCCLLSPEPSRSVHDAALEMGLFATLHKRISRIGR